MTGAGKGLGRAVAVALSQAGADVAVIARMAADLESLEPELAAHGGKAPVLPGPAAAPDAVRTTAHCREAGKVMLARRPGSIINIWSVHAGTKVPAVEWADLGGGSTTCSWLLPYGPQLRPAGRPLGRAERAEHSPGPRSSSPRAPPAWVNRRQ